MLRNSGFIYSQFQRAPRVFDIGSHFEPAFFSKVITNNLQKGKSQTYKMKGQRYLVPKEAEAHRLAFASQNVAWSTHLHFSAYHHLQEVTARASKKHKKWERGSPVVHTNCHSSFSWQWRKQGHVGLKRCGYDKDSPNWGLEAKSFQCCSLVFIICCIVGRMGFSFPYETIICRLTNSQLFPGSSHRAMSGLLPQTSPHCQSCIKPTFLRDMWQNQCYCIHT